MSSRKRCQILLLTDIKSWFIIKFEVFIMNIIFKNKKLLLPFLCLILLSSPVIISYSDDTIKLDKALISKKIIEKTNEERKKMGLPIFIEDTRLNDTARKHSEDMSINNYFAHEAKDQNKRTVAMRLANKKITTIRSAENINVKFTLDVNNKKFTYRTDSNGKRCMYYSTGGKVRQLTEDEMAEIAVDSWMKSPGHRKNILTPDFNRIGVGVAAGKYNRLPALYMTQNFLGCKIKVDNIEIETHDKIKIIVTGTNFSEKTIDINIGNENIANKMLGIRNRDKKFSIDFLLEKNTGKYEIRMALVTETNGRIRYVFTNNFYIDTNRNIVLYK